MNTSSTIKVLLVAVVTDDRVNHSLRISCRRRLKMLKKADVSPRRVKDKSEGKLALGLLPPWWDEAKERMEKREKERKEEEKKQAEEDERIRKQNEEDKDEGNHGLASLIKNL